MICLMILLIQKILLVLKSEPIVGATRNDHAPIAGLLKMLSAVLIAKVTLGVIWNNRFYFPPDFQSEFLIGRRHYFYEHYQYAFFSHVIGGPISLLLGLALVSSRFRIRWPAVHRWVGRIQVINVALIVAPGGFMMALRAAGGPIAVWGFAVLAILTAATVIMGYVTVRQRNFVAHERWMFRCFLLLASAVVLRLIAGLSIVAGIDSDWTYPVSAWASWLVPVAIYEAIWRFLLRRKIEHRGAFDFSA